MRHPAVAAESSVEEILSAIGLNDEDAVTVLCAASAADTQDAVHTITGAQVHSEFAHHLSGCATDNESLIPWKLSFLQVDAVASALADTGVPARHLGKLLRQCPQFLTCSSDTIRRRVSSLLTAGISHVLQIERLIGVDGSRCLKTLHPMTFSYSYSQRFAKICTRKHCHAGVIKCPSLYRLKILSPCVSLSLNETIIRLSRLSC